MKIKSVAPAWASNRKLSLYTLKFGLISVTQLALGVWEISYRGMSLISPKGLSLGEVLKRDTATLASYARAKNMATAMITILHYSTSQLSNTGVGNMKSSPSSASKVIS